jgi:hypothetical protein
MKQAEIKNNKMTDKAAQAAKQVMHSEMKRMLAAHEKGMKEQMAEQS